MPHRLGRAAESLKPDVIPDDVDVVITRNAGLTSNEKVNELVEALAVALIFVVAVLTLGLGLRESLIVALAVPVVFGLTLAVPHERNPLEIELRLPRALRSSADDLSRLYVKGAIILVDFIHLSLARGRSLFDAIMESRVVRLRPILLTAGTAMLSAVPIATAPVFSGLAWSLIFGLLASTVFTLFVIPVTYWLLYAHKPGHGLPASEEEAGLEAVSPKVAGGMPRSAISANQGVVREM